MLGKRKRPKSVKIDSLIGQNSNIKGEVRFGGGLHVDGTIKGNVYADDSNTSYLSVSNRGRIEGDVRVTSVTLNGTVIGDVHTTEYCELAASARVEGNVYYNLVEMEMGAEVNGQLVHTADQNAAKPALSYDMSADTKRGAIVTAVEAEDEESASVADASEQIDTEQADGKFPNMWSVKQSEG